MGRTTAWRSLSFVVGLALAGSAPAAPLDLAAWPAPAWPVAENPSDEARIARLLAAMSVEEKVGDDDEAEERKDAVKRRARPAAKS